MDGAGEEGDAKNRAPLPKGKPINSDAFTLLGILKQLHALDDPVALVPRVFAEGRENLPCLLQRLEVANLDGAPGIVGLDGEGHRIQRVLQ
jgi:hypothetical protein